MNAVKANKLRCIISLVISSIIIVLVFIGLVIRSFYLEDVIRGTEGIGLLKMYTILSNLLVCFSVTVSIPYMIDGLRTGNYHLPRWIVDALYVSTSVISLTFLMAATVIAINKGAYFALAYETNLIFHTIVPILSIFLFVFTNSYHFISFKKTFLAVIPTYIYMLIYLIMAIIIGEENGGWVDFYSTNTIFPWQAVAAVLVPLVFGLDTLLRVLHNKNHQKQKEAMENYYLTSELYDYSNIEGAIKELAVENKKKDLGGELIVPRRIIKILMKRYNANLPIESYLDIYIKYYYEK